MTCDAYKSKLQRLASDFFLPTRDHEQVAQKPVEIEFVKFMERRLIATRQPDSQRQHIGGGSDSVAIFAMISIGGFKNAGARLTPAKWWLTTVIQ